MRETIGAFDAAETFLQQQVQGYRSLIAVPCLVNSSLREMDIAQRDVKDFEVYHAKDDVSSRSKSDQPRLYNYVSPSEDQYNTTSVPSPLLESLKELERRKYFPSLWPGTIGDVPKLLQWLVICCARFKC